MQELDYPPAATPRLKPQFIVLIAAFVLIAALCLFDVFISFHPGHPSHTHTLSPLQQQQIASQLATTQSPADPADTWVESRDGDGTLDVEDVNGPATIYFDRQSHTRLLCIDNTGCYHLRGHHKGSK